MYIIHISRAMMIDLGCKSLLCIRCEDIIIMIDLYIEALFDFFQRKSFSPFLIFFLPFFTCFFFLIFSHFLCILSQITPHIYPPFLKFQNQPIIMLSSLQLNIITPCNFFLFNFSWLSIITISLVPKFFLWYI